MSDAVNGQQARAHVSYAEETRSRFRYDYDAYTEDYEHSDPVRRRTVASWSQSR